MMLKRVSFPLLLIVLAVLAACQPQAEVTLPTLAPTLGQEVVTDEATEPPVTEVTAAPAERATLPPTWTPSPGAPTETPLPITDTPIPTVPPPPSPLSVCAAFGVDPVRNATTFFTLGASPEVYWTPVEGAVSYFVRLINESAEELVSDYVAETTFSFPADLFERDKRYAWEVYPLDNLGQQMCIAIGAELFPQ